ncbi:MAG: hypothetical protein NHB14_00910 [Desulfosporosinus sp.]|nr:hypothetical protein [Desulfosporosinus sp.]MDA8220635.1 hypothetical protein [Desulfitobacterium hafniense]
MPFGGKLNPKNKWCQLAAIIPWAEVERKYAKLLIKESKFRSYGSRSTDHKVKSASQNSMSEPQV